MAKEEQIKNRARRGIRVMEEHAPVMWQTVATTVGVLIAFYATWIILCVIIER